jgi:heat shock protein HtpX
MAIGKRILLFLLTNVLIVVSISVVLNLLGVQPYLTAKGIDYQSLAAFCLVWGFGGAFISLAVSRVMAKWMMKVKVIDPSSVVAEERWLLDAVSRFSSHAGLPKVPEVGVYESDDPNAFATGPTKARALVAVSTGLLRRMNRAEVEGVLAHEIAHVANGDMVTMTLIQGIVNAFVMFFARIVAWSLSQFVEEEHRGVINFVAVLVFDIAFGLLGMMVVAAFSRHREYRADAGGANLVGKPKMVAALKSLQNAVQVEEDAPQSMAAFKISATKKRGFMALISTHPPLEKRINKLQFA